LTLEPPAMYPDAGAGIGFLETIKPLLPIPVLLVLLPALWWFFRDTWKELDDDAATWRAKLREERRTDLRPFVALAMCAVILTLQEYYGGRTFYEQAIRPWLVRLDILHPLTIKLARFDELYGFGWWAFARVFGYVLPFPVWKLCFKEDSLLDMGLRGRGFLKHAWIYGLFLAIVLPLLLIVSRQPDFGMYYPFYKQSSRSWYDFLSWEAMYFAQFFGLEMFFRGFWLGALRRSFGSGAIFAMAVPYCMIHYGKPFLEANGAIVAGIALGSLSMRTKSIYQGFLVHITVAALMDWLALWHRHALPTVFWPPG
jgi:membrane protease YdiL (CAAX protease family)